MVWSVLVNNEFWGQLEKSTPTIPLHRTGNLNHLSLWHHPLSSKNVLSISSSILSTTRCGELYYCHNGEIQGKVFCIAVNLFDGERIQSPQSIALIALLNWAQNIYLNQHMCVHQYISLESSTMHSTPVQFVQIFLRIFHQPETCFHLWSKNLSKMIELGLVEWIFSKSEILSWMFCEGKTFWSQQGWSPPE